VIGDLDTSFDEGLAADFDPKALVLALAVDIAIGTSDGYVTYANNYQVYNDADGRRWWLLSIGPDQAFTANGDLYNGYQGALAVGCMRSRACKAELDNDLLAVVDEMESDDLLGYLQRTRSLIETDCLADPRRELSCDHLDEVLAYVAARPAEIRSQVR
jgi:hypothetical protein